MRPEQRKLNCLCPREIGEEAGLIMEDFKARTEEEKGEWGPMRESKDEWVNVKSEER